MLARMFSTTVLFVIATILVLGGETLSSESAEALGNVATFCNTTFAFPPAPHIGSNPTARQYRELERYGLRVSTQLRGYSVLAPTAALEREFLVAATALRQEIVILKNEVALKGKYQAVHGLGAARNALVRDAEVIATKERVYYRAIGAINTLAAQVCTPATTSTSTTTTATQPA
jgi:hypothetical protein